MNINITFNKLALAPFLVIQSKKKRTQMILNEYKNVIPRNGRYSEEGLKKKEEFY